MFVGWINDSQGAVLVIYCSVINYPKIQRLKTTLNMYYPTPFLLTRNLGAA